MSFCRKCGHQLSTDVKYCGDCGEKVVNNQVSNVPVSSGQVSSNQMFNQVRYVLTANKKEGVVKQTLCYVVFCEDEIIIAHFSKDRQKSAFKLHDEALKNSGVGLIGKIGSKVNFYNNYGEKYYQMSKDMIINEESLNFSVKYQDLSKIKFTSVKMIHYENDVKDSVGKLTLIFDKEKLKFTHKSKDENKEIKNIFKEKCPNVSSYN